jgi:thioredoxin-related protein
MPKNNIIKNTVISILVISVISFMAYDNYHKKNNKPETMVESSIKSIAENKENAVVVIARYGCIHCENFAKVTSQYDQTDFKIYTAHENTQYNGENNSIETIKKSFKNYNQSTPTTYYYKNGALMKAKDTPASLNEFLKQEGMYATLNPEDPFMIEGEMSKKNFDEVLKTLEFKK